jgi:hypothetical protein
MANPVSYARTSAGSEIFIGTAPATYDLAGFGAVTFTPIGEVTSLGSFSSVYNLVTHNPLKTRNVVKRKGSKNDGTISLEAALYNADAGQTQLRAAVESDNSYSFKIVLQDSTTYFFTAQVMSAEINVGGVDQITALTANLEIDNTILVN